MKKLKFLVITISVIIYFIYSTGINTEFIENLDIPAGVGTDIEEKSTDNVKYKAPTSVYIFESNGPGASRVVDGGSSTIGETREERNSHEDKELLFGLQKIYILGEDYARYGIDNTLDILFKTPTINDMGKLVVCKGKAQSMLEYKMTGYKSSADFIEGLLKNAKNHNFFGEDYKLITICIECKSEGRTPVIPYLEIKEKVPTITGMAVFKNSKMVYLLNMEETKFMNLLREDNSNGMLTIRKDSKHYISFEAESKRTVKCHREKGKYYFDINLNINGDVIENELYDNMITDEGIQEKFQKDLAEETKKNCYKFLNEMQNHYKMDMLSLGRNAIAKYGRNTGTDWNEAVSNSNITVNVKIKIGTLGRGDL